MREEELELKVLELLFEVRLTRPKTGGATAQTIGLTLKPDNNDLNEVLNDLFAQRLIEKGERLLMISIKGMDRLFRCATSKYQKFANLFREILTILKNESAEKTPLLLMNKLNLTPEQSEQLNMLELSIYYLSDKELVQLDQRELLITPLGLRCLDKWEDENSFDALL